MKLSINSLDLAYTIDTYGMFNGESCEDGEREYLADEYGLSDDEQMTLSWDYNHDEIVKSLAVESVNLLHINLVQHGDGTIIDIASPPEKTSSPKFYNYTTDSYTTTWTVDENKLLAYVNSDLNKYRNFLRESWGEYVNVGDSVTLEHLTHENNKLMVAVIDMYTREQYDREDYEMQMYEHESTAYVENMTLDDESQKLIDSKGVTA